MANYTMHAVLDDGSVKQIDLTEEQYHSAIKHLSDQKNGSCCDPNTQLAAALMENVKLQQQQLLADFSESRDRLFERHQSAVRQMQRSVLPRRDPNLFDLFPKRDGSKAMGTAAVAGGLAGLAAGLFMGRL